MRAKGVNEAIGFQRGMGSRKSLGVGLEASAHLLVEDLYQKLIPLQQAGIIRIRSKGDLQRWTREMEEDMYVWESF